METKLQQWMKVMQVSDTELAERLGVDRSYVYLLRSGKRPITDGFRWRFAETYGMDMTVKLLGMNERQPEREREREPA